MPLTTGCHPSLAGPWHEVIHGLEMGDPDTVRNGLTGLLNRLNAGPSRKPAWAVERGAGRRLSS